MSDSPQSNPKEVEGVQSPDEDVPMNDSQDPQGGALSYEQFEVKEQDRWLPIANGMWIPLPPFLPFSPPLRPCVLVLVLVSGPGP